VHLVENFYAKAVFLSAYERKKPAFFAGKAKKAM